MRFFPGLIISIVSALVGASFVLAESINVTANVASVCGNNIRELSEQCDGTDLGGATCQSLGYISGTLSCQINCTFNVSACVSGGGGGGGGGYVPPVSITQVIFQGKAYPNSDVTLLKDAQIVASTVADQEANFKITLTGLTAGNYMFSMYSEDNQGYRSSLLTFALSITPNVTTEVSNIFIAPTIDVDKSQVKKGDNISIFGQSTPKSDISIVIHSDQEYYSKIQADKNGIYLYNFDSTPLDMGDHYTKSKAALDGNLTSYSKAITFAVGNTNIYKTASSKCPSVDLNNDCRVNLVDFSILAYWNNRPNPPSKYDFNHDGKVDLIDFSILAHYWTG
jgi:hypothetical protein